MFRPNRTCELSRLINRNLHGEGEYTDPEIIKYAPVQLKTMSEKTTVRADSSASRGTAEEILSDTKILIPTGIEISFDDRVGIEGKTYRVQMVHDRYSVLGNFDHKEIDLLIVPS